MCHTSKNPFADKYMQMAYESTIIPCKYKGCGKGDLLKPLEQHESFCLNRTVGCPGKFASGCLWRDSFENLGDHLF